MDQSPSSLNVGAINPYALTEALTGKTFNWADPNTAKIVSQTLETDYNELFDMKFNSPIFAGLRLNSNNFAEPLKSTEIITRTTADQITPDLSVIKKMDDLKHAGIDRLENITVKDSTLVNGTLNLRLNVPHLNKTLTNSFLTKKIQDIVLPLVRNTPAGYTPPNSQWKDMGDFFKEVSEYNDPIQGAVGNCYFIAALAAIAWSDPFQIMQRTRATGVGETNKVNGIQFFSKGGGKDAPSKLVEVTDNVLISTLNNYYIYCRSNDANELWPNLYEKAFAKWITQDNSDQPDITQTAYGDPAKATAQLNGKTPYYFNTDGRTGDDLFSIVRQNSMSYKTINPMTAWTYGSGRDYSGSNIVGNHAYTVLGWSTVNNKNYIILRNPWGVTEPAGLNTYQGLLSFFDNSFWRPINTIGNDGVFALEANSFQYYYATLGVAK